MWKLFHVKYQNFSSRKKVIAFRGKQCICFTLAINKQHKEQI